MGSFWIFFLFMGIVALIKRNEIANEGKKSQSEQPTADDIRRESERRVKELKGEIPPQVPTQPAQRRLTTRPVERRTIEDARRDFERRVKELEGNTAAQTPPRPAPKPKTQTKQRSQQGSATYQTSNAAPKKQQPTTRPTNDTPAPKSEVERMVEDFSIEKAVIYAEILEPKFKQY